MQLCRIHLLFPCLLFALHVSSDVIAHHQEHLNCSYSFWFYSRVSSAAVMTALHVSSDVITHHQEHLNCSYSFWFYSRVSSAVVITAADDTRE